MSKKTQPPPVSGLLVNQRYESAVPVGALSPHPSNPRTGDVGAIYESITANKFFGAVLAQAETGVILAGEHRWRSAIQAGITEIPVLYLSVDDEQALRILLADNRMSDKADWDRPMLRELLEALADTQESYRGTGFEAEDIDNLIRDLNEPITFDPLDADPDSKPPKQPRRPTFKLTFDTEDELMTFRALTDGLKDLYPHHDSVERRLLNLLEDEVGKRL